MSNISKTAPTLDKQLSRALMLVATLGACSYFSANAQSSSNSWLATQRVALLHLLAFASWFGCSIWVSLVAGIVMFKTLPRHVFGRLQARLFPAYFKFSTATLVVSVATSGAIDKDGIPYLLIVTLAANLLNQLYFEPATTKVMYQRHAVEKRLGTGHEVGKIKPDDPVKANNPELVALSKTFGMLHGISTLLTLGGIGAGCVWLNACADQLASAGP